MVRVPGYRPKSPRDSRDLKRENAELKRAILKPASAFFVAPPATAGPPGPDGLPGLAEA